jgi:hypothetical protein
MDEEKQSTLKSMRLQYLMLIVVVKDLSHSYKWLYAHSHPRSTMTIYNQPTAIVALKLWVTQLTN